MQKISILIPVYNEKNSLLELLRRVEAVDFQLEKEIILIVEVKMRRNKECGTPAEAVNLKKQKRICYTLNYYRMKKQLVDTTAVRFDVIEVDKDLQCHWIKNAFEFQE